MEVKIFLQTQRGVTPERNFYIDLFDDETIELTRSIQDVRDISKQFSDYSREFNIPASPNNNEAFKFFFKTDFQNGYNQHQEANAIIEFKGIPLLAGTIELMGASTYKGKEQSYEVVFYGNVKSISQTMGEDTLPQLDWSAYDHTLNRSNVQDSWFNLLFSGAVVYPLWDCSTRGWYYNSNGNQNNPQNIAEFSGAIELDELKPAIRLKEFIEAMFSNYGLTVNSAWLNNADTLKMYVQPQRSAGLATNPTGGDFNMLVTSSQTLLLTSTNPASKVLFDAETYDYGNSYNPVTSIYTAQYSGEHSFTLEAEQTNGVFGNVSILMYVNGSAIYKGAMWFSSSGSSVSTYWFKETLALGDTVEIYLQFQTPNFTIQLENMSLQKRTDAIPKTGNTVQVDWTMPPIKVSEFFSQFLQTFNLILEPTGASSYTLEPLDDWYDQGTKRYWDAFIDQEELVYEKIPIEKNLLFSHENAEIDSQQGFTKTVNRTFGEVKWDSDLEGDIDFSDGSMEIESPFNVQVPEMLNDEATNTGTQIEFQRFFEEGEPVVSELNIAYFNGVRGCSPYYIQETPQPFQYTFYPNFSFVNAAIPTNSNNSLSFSVEAAINDAIPINTLYQVYYNSYIRRLYDVKTRMVSCKAIISLVEFQGLKLNDIIYFQGINYVINKMVYDFNKQVAKMELISLLEGASTQSLNDIAGNGLMDFELTPSKNDINLYNATQETGTSNVFVNQDQNAIANATFRGQNENAQKIVNRGVWQAGGYAYNSMVTYEGLLAIVTNPDGTSETPDGTGTDFEYLPNGTANPSEIVEIGGDTYSEETIQGEVVIIMETANGTYDLPNPVEFTNTGIVYNFLNVSSEEVTLTAPVSITISGESSQTIQPYDNLKLKVINSLFYII